MCVGTLCQPCILKDPQGSTGCASHVQKNQCVQFVEGAACDRGDLVMRQSSAACSRDDVRAAHHRALTPTHPSERDVHCGDRTQARKGAARDRGDLVEGQVSAV